MANLKDIALKTGFSITTVSRALNGHNDVSEKTKEIILNAAEELSYSPNIYAQNLVKKRSKTIGLLVSDLKKESAKDGFTFQVLYGVNEAAIQDDYEIILLSTSTLKQREKTITQIINQRNLEGLIIQGLKNNDPYIEELTHSSIPVVLIDLPIKNATTGFVTSNQKSNIIKAIKYLERLGHQNIAFMNGHPEAYVSEIRKESFVEGMIKAGLVIDSELFFNGEFSENRAYQIAIEMFLDKPEITAVFCASDLMALGVMRAAKSLNLHIPNDVSIIGYDNILLTQYTSPTLTTIGQDPYLLGVQATKLLFDIINNIETNHQVVIDTEFIIRESTAIKK